MVSNSALTACSHPLRYIQARPSKVILAAPSKCQPPPVTEQLLRRKGTLASKINLQLMNVHRNKCLAINIDSFIGVYFIVEEVGDLYADADSAILHQVTLHE